MRPAAPGPRALLPYRLWSTSSRSAATTSSSLRAKHRPRQRRRQSRRVAVREVCVSKASCAPSKDDLERELRRAASIDELGERVPVDEVGEHLCDEAMQAEASQLLRAPVVNEALLLGPVFEFVFEFVAGGQDRFHRSVLPN